VAFLVFSASCAEEKTAPPLEISDQAHLYHAQVEKQSKVAVQKADSDICTVVFVTLSNCPNSLKVRTVLSKENRLNSQQTSCSAGIWSL